MQTRLECVLDALRRGLFVAPLGPKTKIPATPHGFKDRTRNEQVAKAFWTKWPDANIACNAGVVLDLDKGCKSLPEVLTFAKSVGLPETLVVRSGRRDGNYGAQLHYTGEAMHWGRYEHTGVSGEVRPLDRNLFGLWHGSIHPISGERYEIVVDLPIAPWPTDAKLGSARREFRASATSEAPANLLAARETFERLLREARNAKEGGRNYAAHSVTWFAARAFLAGVFEESENELKQRILTLVNPLYQPGERDVHKMLSDSWRYGRSAGPLALDISFSDLDQIFTIADPLDETTWRLLSGVTTDFSSAIAARNELAELLSVAGFGAEDVKRVLSYSGLDLLAARQAEAELALEAFLKGQGYGD